MPSSRTNSSSATPPTSNCSTTAGTPPTRSGGSCCYLFECFDAQRAELSDRICTALQLTNFWQDVARDFAIGRVYLPEEDRRRFGYTDADLAARRLQPAFVRLMRFEVERTRDLFYPRPAAHRPGAARGADRRGPVRPRRPGRLGQDRTARLQCVAPPADAREVGKGSALARRLVAKPVDSVALSCVDHLMPRRPGGLQPSYAYCERLARREAGNFFHAFQVLPRPQRRAMCALYAFMRQTDDLADGPEPSTANGPR